jgi:hypothetical protein
MTTGPGPYAAEFLRRVRARPVSSWRHGDRERVVRQALDRLAALASGADARQRPPVPDAGLPALADQLEVLIADALGAGADPQRVEGVLREVAGQLGLRMT